MGCGSCGKNVRGSSRVAGRNPAGSQAGRGVTQNGATPQQLQQLLRAQAEREGAQNNTNPVERRRIEKLRRDAIRKALGRG